MNILLMMPASSKDVASSTFMAPALGVLRLAGYLEKYGHHVEMYDPTYYAVTGEGSPLKDILLEKEWGNVDL